jgi:Flp pilus assembly protein TadD
MNPLYHGRAGCVGLALLVAGCAAAPADTDTAADVTINAPALETIDLAERAWLEGRLSDARILLDRVMLADPLNPRTRYLAAELALSQGEARRAAEAFARLVPDPQVGPKALQGRGIAALKLGQERLAFKSLRRAVEADPGLWRAWNALGYYYDRRQAWDQAEASYARAVAANPRAVEARNNHGFSLLMQGRLPEAQEEFERALRLDPRFATARENMRLVLAWQGDYGHALSGVGPAGQAEALNNVGYIALLRGDYANAEAYLLRAMEIDPQYNEIASRNLSYLEDVRALGKRPGGTAD